MKVQGKKDESNRKGTCEAKSKELKKVRQKVVSKNCMFSNPEEVEIPREPIDKKSRKLNIFCLLVGIPLGLVNRIEYEMWAFKLFSLGQIFLAMWHNSCLLFSPPSGS